jgi:drug/metabolite transporter (DMT)-like permease
MYIVIVPIISLLRRQKLSFTVPISVALGVVGLYFLSCVGVTQIATGDLLLIGCAFMFAVQITFVDKFAGNTDPIRLNLIQALVCSALSFVVAFILETPSWEGIMQCLIPLIHTGVFSMGIAYTLQIVGQRHLQSSVASLIMSMESVFAVLFAWLIPPHKTLSEWESIGCIFVFAAVIISQLPTRRK